MHPVMPSLKRNKEIVRTSDLLIVCPHTDKPQLRSGTWMTFRYADRIKKPWLLIYPTLGVITAGDTVSLDNRST